VFAIEIIDNGRVNASGVFRIGAGCEERRDIIALGAESKPLGCSLPGPPDTSSGRRPRLGLDVKITSWKQFVKSEINHLYEGI
jgi:hypothetical protein